MRSTRKSGAMAASSVREARSIRFLDGMEGDCGRLRLGLGSWIRRLPTTMVLMSRRRAAAWQCEGGQEVHQALDYQVRMMAIVAEAGLVQRHRRPGRRLAGRTQCLAEPNGPIGKWAVSPMCTAACGGVSNGIDAAGRQAGRWALQQARPIIAELAGRGTDGSDGSDLPHALTRRTTMPSSGQVRATAVWWCRWWAPRQ